MQTKKHHINLLEMFVLSSPVATQNERSKMADIIQLWQYVPEKNANLSTEYLQIINSFIQDQKINELLSDVPSFREVLYQNILDCLQHFSQKHAVLKRRYKLVVQIIDQLKNMETAAFNHFLANSGHPLRQQLNLLMSKQVDYNAYHMAFRKSFHAYNKEQKQLHKLHQYNAALKIRMHKALDALNDQKDQKQGLKIIGKIDLKTWKPLTNYKTPDVLQRELLEQKKEAIILDYRQQQKGTCASKKKLSAWLIQQKNIQEKCCQELLELCLIQQMQDSIKLIAECIKAAKKVLYKKMDEWRKIMDILSPFLCACMDSSSLWGLSEGIFKHIDVDFLKKYAKLLKDDQAIQELADILGRYRLAEASYETIENEIERHYNYQITHPFGKAELKGICQSNDITAVLPAQLALLSEKDTEMLFLKNFVEHKLQTFKYEDKIASTIVHKETVSEQKRIEVDQGPFIIAVDTSGSMKGSPEQMAKMIAFAITKIAIKDKRKAFLISFSNGIKTFEMSDFKNSLDALVAFLKMSFHGGTDATRAVKKAIQQMQSSDYVQADLLIISDGDFATLDQQTLANVTVMQKLGNKFNALIIGSRYQKQALSFCDNVWSYHPQKNSLKDLVMTVRTNLS